jgi:hypothetical protein
VILSDQNIVIIAGVEIIRLPSSPSGVTVLGEPQPLPKLPSTVVDHETFVSSSSHPCSPDPPQLTQATST